MKLRFRLYVVPLTLLALRVSGKPPPSISLDETVLAQPLPEPPKPVEVVAVPEPLALPAQLKPPELDEAPLRRSRPTKRCAFPVPMQKRVSRLPVRATSTRFRCGRSPMARFIRSMRRRGA